MKVTVIENVLKLNDEVATLNRQVLQQHRITTIDLIGAVGCGKTALVEATLKHLAGTARTAVIVGDLATSRDADRIARWCDQVVQINTGKGCHLEAHHVRQAMGQLDLGKVDYLFIENVGNLICPVGFDLGQDAKIGMFCVATGDDKAAKHPYIVKESSAILLGKTDLLPHMPFDRALFENDVRQLNPTVPIFDLSARTGAGMENWINWLAALRRKNVG